eukprot:330776-Pleurochrysis_carterae.AAC.2
MEYSFRENPDFLLKQMTGTDGSFLVCLGWQTKHPSSLKSARIWLNANLFKPVCLSHASEFACNQSNINHYERRRSVRVVSPAKGGADSRLTTLSFEMADLHAHWSTITGLLKALDGSYVIMKLSECSFKTSNSYPKHLRALY